MALDAHLARSFRDRLKQLRAASPQGWEASRRLLVRSHVESTLKRLRSAVLGSTLPMPLREAVLAALPSDTSRHAHDRSGEPLSGLTGLPPGKALRALCLEFGLLDLAPTEVTESGWSAERLETFVRGHDNPYELLRAVDHPSLLDLGAGDLSFLAEVAKLYLLGAGEPSRASSRLILHGVDRITPGSRLGTLYQPSPEHLSTLKKGATEASLQFKYWGDQDMFALERLGRLVLPRYTLVTCHAPASPTFAYEPRRLQPAVIEAHLRETKGASRLVREDREKALEVREGSRTLLFPPWKFEIRGPLALLGLLAQRAQVAILSSVDADVFWELISQLVDCPTLQSCPAVLTPRLLEQHLGAVYRRLAELPCRERVILGDLIELRPRLPRVVTQRGLSAEASRFRYVEIRRGAHFPGLPVSLTARLFNALSTETEPWMLTLIPDHPAVLG